MFGRKRNTKIAEVVVPCVPSILWAPIFFSASVPAFTVLLVFHNSEGEVRWMEVRDWLKRASDNGKKPVKQIVFEGERFDVMSVRRWRDHLLGGDQP